MAFSRVDLVKRLITEPSLRNGNFVPATELDTEDVFRRRLWNDLNSFVNDSMTEVHSKLDKIEPEIWGKLIVMERNFRTAKAYLRASAIQIDGSKSFFDGNRLGLAQFQNDNRSPKTMNALKALGKGIRVKVDRIGNIWMKKHIESPICVQVAQYPEPLFLTTDYKKIIDLRAFRDSVLHELDITTSLDQEKLFKKSIIFIKLSDAVPEKKPLECALWLALIHLVSVDVVNAIVQANNEQTVLPTQANSNGSPDQTSPLSTPSSSQCDNPNAGNYPRNMNLHKRPSFNGVSNLGGGQNTDSNADYSSESNSSYVPSSASYMTKQSSTKSNSGVARRIFNSQHHHPQRSQSVNHRERTPRTQFRQTSSTRSPSYSSYNQNHTQKSPLHYYSKLNNNMSTSMIHQNENLSDTNDNNRFQTYRKRPQNQIPNGWSLLNLSEIDKMQKPVYYTSAEEADRGRRTKRGGMGHKFNSQSNLLAEKNSNYEDSDLPQPMNSRQPGRRSTSRPGLNIKWLSENSLRNLG